MFLHSRARSFPALLFAKLVNLNKLSLFRREVCGNVIKNNTFEPMKNLPIKDLTIRYDNLAGVEPLAFSWFPNLRNLDMSYTYGLSVADLYPAWYGLRDTRIRRLNLTSFKRNRVNIEPTLIRLNDTFFRSVRITIPRSSGVGRHRNSFSR